VIIGGRRAVRRPADPADCLGSGASNAVSYTIDDGQRIGFHGLAICWRGTSPVLSADIRSVARSLRVAADPGPSGPWPD